MSPDTEPVRCRNCGRPAGPRFCGFCGQEVEERRGPLLSLLRELLSEWLSFDGRLIRSLLALARPGRLTCLYLEGKRASYARPLRLYMVASLLLFSSALDLRAPDASEIDLYVAGERITAAPPTRERPDYVLFETKTLASRWIARNAVGKVRELRTLPPQEVLDRFFSGFRQVLPVALILFLPLLALALKLLYLRTGTFYVDHLVFAAHVQSAVFLLLALAWLVTRLAGLEALPALGVYVGVFVLALAVYLPMALHRVYSQAWWWTALKSVLLIYGYLRLLSIVVGAWMVWVILRI